MIYKVRPYEIEAIQLEARNRRKVKKWCERLNIEYAPKGKGAKGVYVRHPKTAYLYVLEGRFIVYRPDRDELKVMRKEDFNRMYEELIK